MGGEQSSLKKVASTPTFATRLGGRVTVYDSPTTMSPAYLSRLRAEHNETKSNSDNAFVVVGMRRTLSDAGSSGKGYFVANHQSSPDELTPLTSSTKQRVPAKQELISMDIPLKPPPPLSHWIGPALTCAMCYALYNIFIKKGSSSIHPVLGGVILQFVAAILGCILLIGLLLSSAAAATSNQSSATATTTSKGSVTDAVVEEEEGDDDDDGGVLFYDHRGIRWSIAAGIAVGLAEMISFLVSGMGVQAVQSVPIIIGGSVMFGTVLGWMWLGETLSIQGWCGVILLVLGIVLVGTDPAGGGGDGLGA